MSLSEQFQRVDGSQNDILKALARSYGINTSGLKIDQLAAAVKASQKFKQDGLLSTATAGLFDLGANATPDDALKKVHSLIDALQKTDEQKVGIITGSYTGTGTYGEGNKSSIEYTKKPKLIIVSGEWAANRSYGCSFFIADFVYNGLACASIAPSNCFVSWEEGAMKWYSNEDAISQGNVKGNKYDYLMLV